MVEPNREAESTESTRLSSSAPRRTEIIAESNLLMRRSTWCGVVFGLGVLITTLNLVPPVAVRYSVVSEVVVSPSRLASLESLVTATKNAADLASIQSVKVLDRSASDRPGMSDSGEDLVLVQVKSEWEQRCEEDAYTAWLEGLSRADGAKLTQTLAAKQARIARWELEAAEHYASQYDFLASQTASSNTGVRRSFQLASSPTELSGSLTGHSRIVDQTRDQLRSEVTAAKQKLSETELAWQQQIEQSSGALRITGVPEVLPISSKIPIWMAASVLILGLASGSAAGWAQFRLQSGGAYDPQFVAQQLELEGIPVSGKLELSGEQLDRSDWLELASRKAAKASRRTARHLIGISEGLLGFWCLLVLFRLLIDPLWCGVLMDSPLAAFGRLLTGMP